MLENREQPDGFWRSVESRARVTSASRIRRRMLSASVTHLQEKKTLVQNPQLYLIDHFLEWSSLNQTQPNSQNVHTLLFPPGNLHHPSLPTFHPSKRHSQLPRPRRLAYLHHLLPTRQINPSKLHLPLRRANTSHTRDHHPNPISGNNAYL
jgi:hypothetical protein